MAKVLVAVMDKKAQVFNPPVAFENKEDAKRGFYDLCSNRDTLVGRHPEDFALYLVGSFDVCFGVLDVVPRVTLTDGTEYLMQISQFGNEPLKFKEGVEDGE